MFDFHRLNLNLHMSNSISTNGSWRNKIKISKSQGFYWYNFYKNGYVVYEISTFKNTDAPAL